MALQAFCLVLQRKVYWHVHGTAVESLVSVVVTSLWWRTLKTESCLPFPSHFWKHYVDTTCAALPSHLTQTFHSIWTALGHACSLQWRRNQMEDDFPDAQLCSNDDGKVDTLVYHKATHTHQYLSFESCHPVAHWVAVVRTLMTRAHFLSSSGVECAQEETVVTEGELLPLWVNVEALLP